MELIKELSLNRHPQDCKNLSLVGAKNIKISNDGANIVNEEGLISNEYIKNVLYSNYLNNYNIVGIISTSKELILFINTINKNSIYRFFENEHNIIDSYKYIGVNWEYNGGKIKGAYTYNINNELIIIWSEYDSNIDTPLRTLNLDNDNNIISYTNDQNSLMTLVPKINISDDIELTHIKGNAYKGIYFMFIRYKINNYDYTQWYDLKRSIIIDELELNQIMKISTAFTSKYTQDMDHLDFGAIDYTTPNKDIINTSFNIKIKDNNDYFDTYQLGFILKSKTNDKGFRTDDISKNKNIIDYSFTNSVKTISIDELTTSLYNFYDVKQLYNYKNRIYIGDYKEVNYNISKSEIGEDLINNINISLKYDRLARFYNSNYENTVFNKADGYYCEYFANVYSFDDYNQYNKFITNDTVNKIEKYDPQKIKNYPVRYYNIDYNNEKYDIFGIPLSKLVKTSYDGLNYRVNIRTKDSNGVTLGEIDITNKLSKFIFCFSDLEFDQYNNIIINSKSPIILKIKDENNPIITISESQIIVTIYDLYNNSILTISNYEVVPINLYKINVPNKDHNLRSLEDTLLPGEVYKFFIHYVDKYGHATNGIPLNNNITDIKINSNIYKNKIVIPYKYINDVNGEVIIKSYYFVENKDITLKDFLNNIYTNDEVYGNITCINNQITLSQHIGIPPIIVLDKLKNDLFGDILNKLENYDKNIYYDIPIYKLLNLANNPDIVGKSYDNYTILGYYSNSNGDSLFRVPDFIYENPNSEIDKEDSSGTFGINYNYAIKPYGLCRFSINVSNVIIPDGYVKAFISYQKVTKIKTITGILSENDTIIQNLYTDDTPNVANPEDNNNEDYIDTYRLFTGQLDTKDSLNLSGSILQLEAIYQYDETARFIHLDDEIQGVSKYSINHNLILNKKRYNCVKKPIAINSLNLVVADANKYNNIGNASYINVNSANKTLFANNYILNPDIVSSNQEDWAIIQRRFNEVYIASIINIDKDLYVDNTEPLIPLSTYIYNEERINIKYGYNGRITFDSFIVYNYKGFRFDESNLVITNNLGELYYNNTDRKENNKYIRSFGYNSIPVYNDIILEYKHINNFPQTIFFPTKNNEDFKKQRFSNGNIVIPKNSIDLFKYDLDNIDLIYPKLYNQINKLYNNPIYYNKTIRRSEVIQSESYNNKWRIFNQESYKIITENKGKITNIFGIGTLFIVHTEHSMFMFDTNNNLQTVDQNIQLYQPDAFEVDYKEILTSEKGYGGLQDIDSYIIGDFGYIYYDNDSHTLFRYDANNIQSININNIELFFDKFLPKNVRFAHDIYNKRILIKFDYHGLYTDVVSYYYNYQTFISLHDYKFNIAYNTKNNLYLISNKLNNNIIDNTNDTIYNFSHEINYGIVHEKLLLNNSGFNNIIVDNINSSYIDIILNNDYDTVKFLEFIKYRLKKIDNYTDIINNYSPEDNRHSLYSGDIIRIFNLDVDTGDMNVLVKSPINKLNAYKYPFYENGIWNFNYFVNKITQHPILKSDTLPRLYGNYLVIRFIFNNTDNKRIEFGGIEYKITINRLV